MKTDEIPQQLAEEVEEYEYTFKVRTIPGSSTFFEAKFDRHTNMKTGQVWSQEGGFFTWERGGMSGAFSAIRKAASS